MKIFSMSPEKSWEKVPMDLSSTNLFVNNLAQILSSYQNNSHFIWLLLLFKKLLAHPTKNPKVHNRMGNLQIFYSFYYQKN